MIALEVSCQSSAEVTRSTFRYAFEQDEVLVGRGEAVDVRLPHPAISLVHLRLRRKQQQLFVLDPGSTNGTFLDGRRLEAGRAVALAEQSSLQIGPFLLRLGTAAAPEPTPPADTAAFARQMVLELLGAVEGGGQCYLEVESGPQRGERLELPALSPPLRLGRGEECQLQLRDADVSRQHLELQLQGDRVLVRDLGSKNGFSVNGRRASGTQPLEDGDRLSLGNSTLVFCSRAQRYLRSLQQPDSEPPEAADSAAPQRLPDSAPGPAPSAASVRPEAAGLPGRATAEQAAGPSAQASWTTAVLAVVAGALVLVALAAIVYLLI